MVAMPLAKLWRPSVWKPVFHWKATSTKWAIPAMASEPVKWPTASNSRSLDWLRWLTKSTMPPEYLNTVHSPLAAPSAPDGPGRRSRLLISRSRFRNAIIWNRSSRVWKRNETSSKTAGSGQKRTTVPVRAEGPASARAVSRSPPLANDMRWTRPPRWTATSTRSDRALTTESPTPCRPPETL